MKLGFVTAIVPELPFEQVLALARDQGFDCVEVMCWPIGRAERKYAGVTHIDVTSFAQDRADASVMAVGPEELNGVAANGRNLF
jgi:sugar phosphate isomerase/epimerase